MNVLVTELAVFINKAQILALESTRALSECFLNSVSMSALRGDYIKDENEMLFIYRLWSHSAASAAASALWVVCSRTTAVHSLTHVLRA